MGAAFVQALVLIRIGTGLYYASAPRFPLIRHAFPKRKEVLGDEGDALYRGERMTAAAAIIVALTGPFIGPFGIAFVAMVLVAPDAGFAGGVGREIGKFGKCEKVGASAGRAEIMGLGGGCIVHVVLRGYITK
jgi:hypothetical protein